MTAPIMVRKVAAIPITTLVCPSPVGTIVGLGVGLA
jgi:hypothetical protein